MSYARFSSDNWKSDVYAYTNSSDDLVTVHVAGNRGPVDSDNESSQLDFIDDEYAGQIHRGLTISEAIVFMHTLSKRGYHVPDDVVPQLQENRHEVAVSPEDLPGGVSMWSVEEAESVEDTVDFLGWLRERRNAGEMK